MTQPSQTIDTPARLDRFTLGIFSPIAPARLVSAPTATQSPAITSPSGYQPPANEAVSLMFAGIQRHTHAIAKHYDPDQAPIADLERQFEAGGEGVEISARSQSSQSIPPRRKLSQCPRP